MLLELEAPLEVLESGVVDVDSRLADVELGILDVRLIVDDDGPSVIDIDGVVVSIPDIGDEVEVSEVS